MTKTCKVFVVDRILVAKVMHKGSHNVVEIYFDPQRNDYYCDSCIVEHFSELDQLIEQIDKMFLKTWGF